MAALFYALQLLRSAAAIFLLLRDFHFVHWLMISLIASVAGTIGDILESKLKRLAGVKDSGNYHAGTWGISGQVRFIACCHTLCLAVCRDIFKIMCKKV